MQNTEGLQKHWGSLSAAQRACFLARKSPIQQKAEDKKHRAFILFVWSKVLLGETTLIPHGRRTHFSSLGLWAVPGNSEFSTKKKVKIWPSDFCFHIRSLILNFGKIPSCRCSCVVVGWDHSRSRFTLWYPTLKESLFYVLRTFCSNQKIHFTLYF